MKRLALCILFALAATAQTPGPTTAGVEQKQAPWIIPAVLRTPAGDLLWASAEAVARDPRLLPEYLDSDQPIALRTVATDKACSDVAAADPKPRTIAALTPVARDVIAARVYDIVPGFGPSGPGSMLRLKVEPKGTAYLFVRHARFQLGEQEFCSGASAMPVAIGDRIHVVQILAPRFATPPVFFDTEDAFLAR